MFLEFYQLVVFQLLLNLVNCRIYMELLERSTVVIVVPLLSVMKDQVKGYQTQASECFPSRRTGIFNELSIVYLLSSRNSQNSIHTDSFPEAKVWHRKLKYAKILSKIPGEYYSLSEVARVVKHFICIRHI